MNPTARVPAGAGSRRASELEGVSCRSDQCAGAETAHALGLCNDVAEDGFLHIEAGRSARHFDAVVQRVELEEVTMFAGRDPRTAVVVMPVVVAGLLPLH